MKRDLNSNDQPPVLRAQAMLRLAAWTLQLAWTTNKGMVVGLVIASLASSLLPAAAALNGRALVNSLVEVVAGRADIVTVLPVVVVGALLALASSSSSHFETYFKNCLTDDLNLRVMTDILRHAAGLDISTLEDKRYQDIYSRAHDGAVRYLAQFLTSSLSIVSNVIQAVSFIGILSAINSVVVWLIAILMLPYLLVRFRLSRMQFEREYRRTTARRWSNYYSGRLTDARSYPETRILKLPPLLLERHHEAMDGFRRQDRQMYQMNLWASVAFGIFSAAGMYLALGWVATFVPTKNVTVGDVTIYINAAMRLRGSFMSVIQALSMMREGVLYLSNLQEFFKIQPRIHETGVMRPEFESCEIEFEHVSFAYSEGGPLVLDDLSFSIRPGETIALVGENGAGKTTLVHLLARLYEPGQGQIRVNRINLQELALDHWQNQIGFVFQNFGVYEGTVHENIAFGDWRALLDDSQAVMQLGRRANVDEMIRGLPQGYDTLLGRLFGEVTLSRGQWQRIAIARAFARQDASLLILDEPTASLDARAEYELFTRFRQLAEGRTTILISHRFSTVSMADRILVLNKGKIVEQGTHKQLVKQGGVYANMHALHWQQAATAETQSA